MSFQKERFERIREEVDEAARRAGRSPSEIILVAVSKKKPVEDVLSAMDAGQMVFGENYVQEAAAKIAAIRDFSGARGTCPKWHFIGHLQRNKAKVAAELFDFIETVDSMKLLRAIGRHADARGSIMPVLLQVNIGQEESKSGMMPGDVGRFLDQYLEEKVPGVEIQGLMVLPPRGDGPEDSRRWFAAARELRDELQGSYGPDLDLKHLSMGMSGDYVVAIEEGATIVRIGTALFGARL